MAAGGDVGGLQNRLGRRYRRCAAGGKGDGIGGLTHGGAVRLQRHDLIIIGGALHGLPVQQVGALIHLPFLEAAGAGAPVDLILGGPGHRAPAQIRALGIGSGVHRQNQVAAAALAGDDVAGRTLYLAVIDGANLIIVGRSTLGIHVHEGAKDLGTGIVGLLGQTGAAIDIISGIAGQGRPGDAGLPGGGIRRGGKGLHEGSACRIVLNGQHLLSAGVQSGAGVKAHHVDAVIRPGARIAEAGAVPAAQGAGVGVHRYPAAVDVHLRPPVVGLGRVYADGDIPLGCDGAAADRPGGDAQSAAHGHHQGRVAIAHGGHLAVGRTGG